MLDKVKSASAKYGLKLNIKKTKAMIVSKTSMEGKTLGDRRVKLKIDGEEIEQVDHFCYLGSEVTMDGRCNKEIKSRIGKAKTQFTKLRKLLSNQKISVNTRKRMIICYVWSILLYGMETWTMNAETTRRIEAFEMWCYRRMLNISWKRKLTNERILEMAKEKRKLTNTIKRRKLEYCGHVLRHNTLLQRLLEGRIDGKRAKGRQRRTWLDDICEWTEIKKKCTIIRMSKERDEWHHMISNLQHKGDGT